MSALAVRTSEQHPVRWLSAAPLWAADGTSAEALERMRRPALLALESDAFMDDLVGLLADAPERLGELEAKPRSYRMPPPGSPPGTTVPLDHVKLYQPVHGHFNLVAATLVCRVVGLPDKAIDSGAGDHAGFVVRRRTATGELAWNGETWIAVDAPERLADAEAPLPLFPVPYSTGDRSRRLLVGVLPTASPQSFPNAGPARMQLPADPSDRRLDDLDGRVIRPLRDLREAPAAERVEPSWFVLLDLGELLLRDQPVLWAALQARSRPAADPPRGAYDFFATTFVDPYNSVTWLDVLLAVWGQRARIWGDEQPAPDVNVDLGYGVDRSAALRAALVSSLPAESAATRALGQPAFATPKLDPRPETRYVVRCVYRRPQCAPLHPDVLSAPSEPFAIAPFFDIDAPARDIVIPLPVDTSIAGLRKAPRNVSLLLSDQLRRQVGRVNKKSLDGDLDEDPHFNLGVICSLSIPIITICALILLLLLVMILNLIFWWMPFFRICFPIPLKARN